MGHHTVHDSHLVTFPMIHRPQRPLKVNSLAMMRRLLDPWFLGSLNLFAPDLTDTRAWQDLLEKLVHIASPGSSRIHVWNSPFPIFRLGSTGYLEQPRIRRAEYCRFKCLASWHTNSSESESCGVSSPVFRDNGPKCSLALCHYTPYH